MRYFSISFIFFISSHSLLRGALNSNVNASQLCNEVDTRYNIVWYADFLVLFAIYRGEEKKQITFSREKCMHILPILISMAHTIQA